MNTLLTIATIFSTQGDQTGTSVKTSRLWESFLDALPRIGVAIAVFIVAVSALADARGSETGSGSE